MCAVACLAVEAVGLLNRAGITHTLKNLHAVALALAVAPVQAGEAILAGRAETIDNDTIEIRRATIRLKGIAAPGRDKAMGVPPRCRTAPLRLLTTAHLRTGLHSAAWARAGGVFARAAAARDAMS